MSWFASIRNCFVFVSGFYVQNEPAFISYGDPVTVSFFYKFLKSAVMKTSQVWSGSRTNVCLSHHDFTLNREAYTTELT